MDPRHPNIAFAANAFALLVFICLLFSAFLPFGTPRGWSNPETVLLLLIPILASIAWWAKKEHEVPVVHEHGSSNAQYEMMEDLPTMVSLDNQHGVVNTNTAAVIQSIVGSQTTQDASAISNAINTLSTGEIGAASASAVAENVVEHTKVNTEKFDVRGFQTEGVSSVPLPKSQPADIPELPEMVALPDLSDLDDLFESDDNETSLPALDLPELPDF